MTGTIGAVTIDWTNLVAGAVVAVVLGIPFVWFGVRMQVQRVAPRLAFRSLSMVVVSPASQPNDEVEIRFRGAAVPRVTRSLVTLWNPGTSPIDRLDVVGGRLLSLGYGGGHVLRARVVRMTREAVGFTVREDGKRAACDFDILDAKDGALLEVMHTGGLTPPRFDGAIKGLPDGPKNFGKIDARSGWVLLFQAREDDSIQPGLSAALTIVGALLALLAGLSGDWIPAIGGALMFVIGALSAWVWHMRWSARRPPSALLADLDPSV